MSYLIVAALTEAHAKLLPNLVDAAVAFLATGGAVTRSELGRFMRVRSGKEREVLTLVKLEPDETRPASSQNARTLERALKSTLEAVGVSSDIRVFLTDTPR